MIEKHDEFPVFLYLSSEKARYLGLGNSSADNTSNRVFRITEDSCSHWGWYSKHADVTPKPRYTIHTQHLKTVNALYQLSGDLHLAVKDYLFSID